MPMDYTFEMVFTGLCAFSFDEKGATVYLVNATRVGRFLIDPDLSPPEIPVPHVPRLSFAMEQQVREGGRFRTPERVFLAADGEEVGVCNVEGEELTLEIPGGPDFTHEELPTTPAMTKLLASASPHPLLTGPLPNTAAVTRLRLSQGRLKLLRNARSEGAQLQIDFRSLRHFTAAVTQPQQIADGLVLTAEHVSGPVVLKSDRAPRVELSPVGGVSTSGPHESVRVTLSNYHEELAIPGDAAYDFLWFYEMLDFPEGFPSRLDLPIPFYRAGGGGLTGSSGVCPPAILGG